MKYVIHESQPAPVDHDPRVEVRLHADGTGYPRLQARRVGAVCWSNLVTLLDDGRLFRHGSADREGAGLKGLLQFTASGDIATT